MQKMELRKMYGKNGPSPKKHLVVQGLKVGKNFYDLSKGLGIAQATAEVYATDCLAAGVNMDHQSIAKYLKVSEETFELIKSEIIKTEDHKLRTIRDNLRDEFSYNSRFPVVVTS